MNKHLLFILMLLLPTGLFSQQPCGSDSIVIIEDTCSLGATSDQFNPQTIDPQTAVVTFSQGSGKYAFDEWFDGYEQALLIRDEYENISGYYVPCKLLPPGRTDKVAFEVKQTGKDKIDESKITFPCSR